jgi:uncharacterized protein YqgC (DUF456 family)
LDWFTPLSFNRCRAIELDLYYITLIIALGICILDYIFPVLGTKRFGGTKAGMVGTSIGSIAPIPGGIIIPPFFVALISELLNKTEFDKAVKAAVGSFLSFTATTFIKFILIAL